MRSDLFTKLVIHYKSRILGKVLNKQKCGNDVQLLESLFASTRPLDFQFQSHIANFDCLFQRAFKFQRAFASRIKLGILVVKLVQFIRPNALLRARVILPSQKQTKQLRTKLPVGHVWITLFF